MEAAPWFILFYFSFMLLDPTFGRICVGQTLAKRVVIKSDHHTREYVHRTGMGTVYVRISVAYSC